jgi:hypothetical protein
MICRNVYIFARLWSFISIKRIKIKRMPKKQEKLNKKLKS